MANHSLRDYQNKYKQELYNLWQKYNSIMLQMPTGTGKTILFASIVRDIHELSVEHKKAYRVLILVHRKELVDQISFTLSQKYNIAHGRIQSNFTPDLSKPTQVASVQTLRRRIKKWNSLNFDFIIIDEAHHALAPSYKFICELYPKAKILGVTATPYRMNGQSFKPFFNEIVVSQPVSKFIEQGYLSQYEYYSIAPTSAMEKAIAEINTFDIDGDYSIAAMSKTLDKSVIHAKLLSSYQKFAEGKKGIIYTVNKKHNEHVCQTYREAGYSVEAIDSDTPMEQRNQIIQQFKAGKIKILCNVNLFTEGFDCPDVEFIQIARPTKSLGLYLQQVGRGLRIHPDGKSVFILDNVGSYNKFGLPSSYRNWQIYFDGFDKNNPPKNEKEEEITSVISFKYFDDKNDIIELDKEMVAILNTSKEDTSDKKDDLPYDAFEDFYIPKKIDGRDVLIIDLINFHYDEWTQSAFDNIEWEFEIMDENDTETEKNDIQQQYLNTSIKKIIKNNKWGLYDTQNNKILLLPLYDSVDGPNNLGICHIIKDGLLGLYDVFENLILIEPQYEEITDIRSLDRINQFKILKEGFEGIIDKYNNVIIPIEFDFIDFSASSLFDRDDIVYGSKNGIYVMIDNKNQVISHLNKKNKAGEYYIAEFSGMKGLVDSGGNIKLPAIYDQIEYKYGKFIVQILHFYYSLLDKNLHQVIPFAYSKMEFINEWYLIVKESKFGIIDVNGNIIIELQYDQLIVTENIITVNFEKEWCVLDSNNLST